jgi:hypothetical protein
MYNDITYAVLTLILLVIYDLQITTLKMHHMWVINIIPIDATTIGQIPLNMLWRNSHYLCFVTHDPYSLHSYNPLIKFRLKMNKNPNYHLSGNEEL